MTLLVKKKKDLFSRCSDFTAYNCYYLKINNFLHMFKLIVDIFYLCKVIIIYWIKYMYKLHFDIDYFTSFF